MALVDAYPEPEVHSLSDEELADQLLVNTERLVVEHPELVLRVAEVLGWQVVPPTGAFPVVCGQQANGAPSHLL